MIFGTFCIAMTAHIFFTYPETVKKSLEEIDTIFDDNVPAWRTTTLATFEDKVAEVQATGGIKGATVSHQEEGTSKREEEPV